MVFPTSFIIFAAKTSMKIYKLLLMSLSLLLIGCNDRRVSSKLAETDSLLAKELNDSAYQIIQTIQEENLKDPEERAYYKLLKFKTAYLVTQKLPSEELLDSVFAFYQHNKDLGKLAECYYYKAVGLHKKKDFERSILYYKEAEKLANSSENSSTSFKIAEGMSCVNSICGNYDLALRYAKNALVCAEEVDRKDWIVHAYYRIGTAYLHLGKEDSSFYYYDKTEPYLNYVKEPDQPYFLTNLSLVYIESNPPKAKNLLLESLKHKELSNSLELLAFIYYNEGNQEKAYQLWKRALKVNDLTPKDNIIHNLLEYDIEHGKTDEVCEQVNEIIAIKDSIINKVKNDTIRDLQIRFDHQVEMNAANVRLIHWQWALGGAIFLAFCLIGYIIWKKHKTKLLQIEYEMQITKFSHQILEQEMEIAKAEKNILELRSTDSQNQDEIKRLVQIKELAQQEIEEMEKKMEKWQGKEAGKIRKGIKLYDEVVQNKIVQIWTPDDYEAFIMFYEVGNYRVIKKMRKQYPGITQRNMLYLILVDMGKTKEEISHIMSLNKSSLRSVRHRLNHWKDLD